MPPARRPAGWGGQQRRHRPPRAQTAARHWSRNRPAEQVSRRQDSRQDRNRWIRCWWAATAVRRRLRPREGRPSVPAGFRPQVEVPRRTHGGRARGMRALEAGRPPAEAGPAAGLRARRIRASASRQPERSPTRSHAARRAAYCNVTRTARPYRAPQRATAGPHACSTAGRGSGLKPACYYGWAAVAGRLRFHPGRPQAAAPGRLRGGDRPRRNVLGVRLGATPPLA
mmetsp:Transcript_37519/g.120607  ORF Transcript_37519/g.120607 Transcript_37519/m.120607 type:complete len:227 (-) Transcript_37519:1981-2661(-)